MSKVTVVIGAQWGDEGKGKLIDKLSEDVDFVCRCQGGNNAGHTVVHNGTSYFFHLLPSGMAHSKVKGIIGNGVVLNIKALFDEIDEVNAKGLLDIASRIFVSNRCHLALDLHKEIDHLEEESKGSGMIGTTKKGIGPAYSSKVARNGLRVCDLMGDWHEFCDKFNGLVNFSKGRYPELEMDPTQSLEDLRKHRERLTGMVCDTVTLINRLIRTESKRVLVEGAQSCMLDIDFGTYPHVTSSNCSVGGVCTGLGIPPSFIGDVYGVVKVYTTRVGNGCFPTEITDALGDTIRRNGREFGVTTGRPRRIGWMDTVVVRYGHQINNFAALALTKLDVLSGVPEVKICRSYMNPKTGEELTELPASAYEMQSIVPVYETLPGWTLQPECTDSYCTYSDLPSAARHYIETVERLCGVPIRWVGIGPSRNSIVMRDFNGG